MFDMDGTLVNSRSAIVSSYRDAATEVLGEPHPTDEDELEEILKLRGVEAFPRIVGDDPDKLAAFRTAFAAAYATHGAIRRGFPGLIEALERLTAMGVRLGIATSKARVRLDVDLERLGIADYFPFTVSGDDVRNVKPAPEPIFALASRPRRAHREGPLRR